MTQVLLAAGVLVLVLTLGMVYAKGCPLGLLLIIASFAAALATGFGFALRHVVEGMFTYLNIVLICATGVVFLKALEESGAAAAMTRSLVLAFHRRPVLLIVVMMLLLLVPGMLTGIAVNSVLSVGVLVAPIMIALGIPRVTTAVIIGLGSILSMLVPPTNLLAMGIAAGINAPFEGISIPSLFLSVPLAILTGLVLGVPHLKKVALADLLMGLPDDGGLSRSLRPWLPLLAVVAIMTAIRAFPRYVPDIGTPLTFVCGTLIAAFTGRRINLAETAGKALSGPMLPVLELLIGVGAFVQVATLTGVRGLLVVASLSLPSLAAYPAAALSLILSGGVLSPFGAAAIFGVPFALFFLGRNQIVTIAALALLAALSQFTLPTAIAGRFAADVAGVADYRRVWKASLLPVGALAVVGLVFIGLADQIARIIL